jgi:hypothetical protein
VDEKNDQIAHHRIVAGGRNPKELWPKQQFASHKGTGLLISRATDGENHSFKGKLQNAKAPKADRAGAS